jgi:3-oxoacyl-[acyl-carrier protein] reductase
MSVMEERCVIVLGASGTLGQAVVKSFREAGYRVLGTGFHRSVGFEPSLLLDASQPDEMPRLDGWIKENTTRVDMVVHCIGVAIDELIAKMEEEQWDRSLGVNLKSAFLVSQVLLKILIKQKSGQFVFVGSWGGRVGRAGQANYSAAKSALVGLSQSIAKEYASRGIRSNVVIPGVFKSAMTDSLSAEALDRLWAGAALKEFADLEEISKFIVHLGSMKGVTGQVFQLDGRIR